MPHSQRGSARSIGLVALRLQQVPWWAITGSLKVEDLIEGAQPEARFE